MRHGNFFELNVEADRFQLGGDIFDGFLRLGRAGQARSDVVRKMRDLTISVIARERGLLELFERGESLRGVRRRRWRGSGRRRRFLRETTPGQNQENNSSR